MKTSRMSLLALVAALLLSTALGAQPKPLFNVKTDKAELTFHGRIQVIGSPYVGQYCHLDLGDVLQQEGFRLRRTRFGITGVLYKKLSFELTTEFFDHEEAPEDLLDAWFDFKAYDWMQIRMGAMKSPFSKGYLFSSGLLTFTDRPYIVKGLAPSRLLGGMLHGGFLDGIIKYQAGVYNGLLKAEHFFSGYDSVGIKKGNRLTQMSFIGRLDIEPLGDVGKHIADLYHGDLKVGFGGGVMYSMDPEILGYSGYLHLKVKGFSLFGEFLLNHSKPSTAPTVVGAPSFEIKSMGAFGILTYTIFPGFLSIGAKAEWIDQNTEAEDQGDELIYGGVVTMYLVKEYLKFQLEFTHREELHGASVDNDSLLGQFQLMF